MVQENERFRVNTDGDLLGLAPAQLANYFRDRALHPPVTRFDEWTFEQVQGIAGRHPEFWHNITKAAGHTFLDLSWKTDDSTLEEDDKRVLYSLSLLLIHSPRNIIQQQGVAQAALRNIVEPWLAEDTRDPEHRQVTGMLLDLLVMMTTKDDMISLWKPLWQDAQRPDYWTHSYKGLIEASPELALGQLPLFMTRATYMPEEWNPTSCALSLSRLCSEDRSFFRKLRSVLSQPLPQEWQQRSLAEPERVILRQNFLQLLVDVGTPKETMEALAEPVSWIGLRYAGSAKVSLQNAETVRL